MEMIQFIKNFRQFQIRKNRFDRTFQLIQALFQICIYSIPRQRFCLAFSGLLVAGSWIVVVANTGFATATRSARIAKVVVSALVTTGARVAGFAIAPDFLVSWLSRIGHEGASGGKLLLRIQASWTHARTAWDVGSAQARVAIITVLTTIAI